MHIIGSVKIRADTFYFVRSPNSQWGSPIQLMSPENSEWALFSAKFKSSLNYFSTLICLVTLNVKRFVCVLIGIMTRKDSKACCEGQGKCVGNIYYRRRDLFRNLLSFRFSCKKNPRLKNFLRGCDNQSNGRNCIIGGILSNQAPLKTILFCVKHNKSIATYFRVRVFLSALNFRKTFG